MRANRRIIIVCVEKLFLQDNAQVIDPVPASHVDVKKMLANSIDCCSVRKGDIKQLMLTG